MSQINLAVKIRLVDSRSLFCVTLLLTQDFCKTGHLGHTGFGAASVGVAVATERAESSCRCENMNHFKRVIWIKLCLHKKQGGHALVGRVTTHSLIKSAINAAALRQIQEKYKIKTVNFCKTCLRRWIR